MQTLAETLPTAISQAKANGQGLQSSNPQPNSVTLIEDANARKQLSNFLFQCFDALKVYGKEPEQMKNLNSMFQMVLADYTYEQIQSAFAFYLKNNTELPAPADIASIIERGNKPALDRSVYVSISKKEAAQRTSEEWQYMREYEYFQLTGTHKKMPNTKPGHRAGAITL